MKIKKVYVDVLTALAKGTDAGIYRLNPKRVEIVSCEQDVKRVLAECEKTGKSVTFKAGGTSLSGQTITDSVLMESVLTMERLRFQEMGVWLNSLVV